MKQWFAPTTDMTGMGAAIGGDRTAANFKLKGVREDLGDTPCWAVGGHPLWRNHDQLGAFGDPVPMVVSGVNRADCGRSALHSGTVGAALTAANNGAPGSRSASM